MKNVTQSAREKCALARANIITRNGPARATFSRIDVRMEANRESPPITFRRTRALCLIGLRSSSPRYYNTCKSALLIGISLDITHAWEGIRHLSLSFSRAFSFFSSLRGAVAKSSGRDSRVTYGDCRLLREIRYVCVMCSR